MKPQFRIIGHKKQKLINDIIYEVASSSSPKNVYRHIRKEWGDLVKLKTNKLTGILSYVKQLNGKGV